MRSSREQTGIVGPKPKQSSSFILAIVKAGILLTSLTIVAQLRLANCEAKEFDWSDLGVSLSGAKTSIGSSPANNLRILVSPQRRMTKNYDFDYNSTASQPVSNQGETSYVIPGSGGNSAYLTQSVNQLPGHSSHSSAYSALSASLASLKSRLNARGVSLSSSLSESNVSNLYPNSVSNFGSSLLLDSQQAPQSQPQVQPTYLSVSNQHEQPANTYSGSHSQSNDNKTIVLAIPAKINFLTDGRSSASKHQQQQSQPQQIMPQQLTVLQQTNEQPTRPDYSTKQQIGVISNSDGSVDQNGQVVSNGNSGGTEQEHHQYVIVNSPPQTNDHSHIVTTNTGTIQSHAPIYSNVYPTVQHGNLGSFSMKYIPTYQQAAVQQPTVQKVFSAIEHNAPVDPVDQSNRYTSCLDTCNSADPRWRKYTVSKYKYCCSRSSQYDPQFDVPSAEKVGEASSKYSDDAYYNYLYRRTRARRSKKGRQSRYHRYNSVGSPVSSEDESTDSGPDSMRPSSVRNLHDSPYMRYYKSRQQPPAEPEAQRELPDSPAVIGKFASKDKTHRRARSRDFDAPESQSTHDNNEEENGYNQRETTRSYGNGDFQPESGRYPLDPRGPIEEDDSRANFDDAPDSDGPKSNGEMSDYSSVDQPADSQFDEPEPDNNPNYNSKYPTLRRRKHTRGNRLRRPAQLSKDPKYIKKSPRKSGRYNSKSEHPSSSQTNGTDYESAQAGDQYHQDQVSDDDQSYQKETTGAEMGNGESDPLSVANNKHKQGLNDSTVAHLSKTTMHLKEILTLLEKKAQLRANDSITGQALTSTPAPPTTTTSLYSSSLFNSAFNSPSLSSSFSSDYLSSELGLKSPYSSSLSSTLGLSGLSLPSSYGSLTSDFGSLSALGSTQFGALGQVKNLPMPHGQNARKRRVNKNLRYNSLMLPKTHGSLSPTTSLLHAAGKSALLSSPYYSPLQYPYWYTRGSSPAVTNSYPYKNIKSPYPSILNGPVSSKLAAAAAASGALYSDESRNYGLPSYDPISTVASSLRPSTTMRLRTKPFVLQPQVLPIYSRHTILGPNLEVKK